MRRFPAVPLAAAAFVLLASSCGGDGGGVPLLVLDTTAGTAVVDAGTGQLVQLAQGGAATPDGSMVFDTRAVGPMTVVRASAAGEVAEAWGTTVPGSYEARVASADGSMLALGPARAGSAALAPGTLAPGRTSTTLVIASSDGSLEDLELPGNIEPEAFSVDGAALFVVDYQPAAAPTHYQVRRLDLATGELGDVYSVDAELQRSMRGTARTQVWDPDGDRLYTLYTLESGTAFVHVLDLDEQWAHCVDLPAGIGASTAGMALSDDGRSLYVADAAAGGLAEVDTGELVVTDEGELPGPSAVALSAPAPSVATLDGRRLLVASGGDIHVVDRGSLEVVDRFRTTGPILGLQSADALYVAVSSAVVVLDADTGEVVRTLPVDLRGGTVLSLGGRSIPVYAGIECAC